MDFVAYVENQFGASLERFSSVKRFKIDGGGEYQGAELSRFFKTKGITYETTPPYSHESNGVAERYNRTVITDTRLMINSNTATRRL